MTFQEAFQQYLDESDPDIFSPRMLLYEWFYNKGKEDLCLSDPMLIVTRKSVIEKVVEDVLEIVDEVVEEHKWGNDGSCGINTAIKSAIKRTDFEAGV